MFLTLACSFNFEFQVYDRLGVSLIERGESFYQDLMKNIVDYLNKKNFLEEDEGRKVMFAKGIQVS
jgi:arginyl-tRNA synthetase